MLQQVTCRMYELKVAKKKNTVQEFYGGDDGKKSQTTHGSFRCEFHQLPQTSSGGKPFKAKPHITFAMEMLPKIISPWQLIPYFTKHLKVLIMGFLFILITDAVLDSHLSFSGQSQQSKFDSAYAENIKTACMHCQNKYMLI